MDMANWMRLTAAAARVFCFGFPGTGFDRAKASIWIENMKISCVFTMEGCAPSHPQRLKGQNKRDPGGCGMAADGDKSNKDTFLHLY
jgi:hypothetical protein